MPVTPSGRLSLPLMHLRNTLAGSAKFQELVGAANATEAKEKIYYGGCPEDDDHAPPRAIIRLDDGPLADRTGSTTWKGTGPIEMLLTIAHPDGITDYHEAYISITNDLGDILDQMFDLVTEDPGAGPYLEITNVSRRAVGQWDADSEGTDAYWECEFSVDWEGM